MKSSDLKAATIGDSSKKNNSIKKVIDAASMMPHSMMLHSAISLKVR